MKSQPLSFGSKAQQLRNDIHLFSDYCALDLRMQAVLRRGIGSYCTCEWDVQSNLCSE